ncbi:amidohydrolase [Zhongshania aliphaticivorans]|uniref:amidohydrolase n=1 Tax=Zhongshania aliphaticivorans TaxID=1470434 RepID=UPI0039C999C1
MKKIIVGLLVFTLLLAAVVLSVGYYYLRGATPALPPLQLFIHGQILTMDDSNRVVSAMAVRGERIEALGSNDEILALRQASTVVYDLKGKTLLPGFIDAHGHFPGTGLSAVGSDLSSPPLGAVRSISDIQQHLAEAAKTGKDEDWLFGFGYDDSLLLEKRHPNRHDLDAVSTTRPIYLMHSSGHLAVVNTAGLRRAGINAETSDPEGGVIVREDNSTQPSGLLLEHATDLVAAQAMDFSGLDFLAMVDAARDQYLAAGVTTIQSGGVDSRLLNGLYWLSKLQRIPQRVLVWPLADKVEAELNSGALSLDDFQSDTFAASAIKIIVDGSIQGYTAFLSEPYYQQQTGSSDPAYRGFSRYKQDELNAQVKTLHCKNYQLALHGNGDAAIDMVLTAIEYAQQACPRADARPILVHGQMARADQITRMKQQGVTPSFFSAHTYFWGDRHRDQFLGPERGARISPLAEAVAEDLRFTVHLDSPVVPMDMARLLWTSVTRQTRSGEVLGADQRINTLQALRAVTIDAAWQSFKEQDIGSLETGKLADLVLLDRDPLASDDNLLNFKVDQVWIAGRCYFQRDRNECDVISNESR